MNITPEQTAAEVLELIPAIMRDVREEMRRHRRAGLSVTQFRVLGFLDRHTGTSLSDVADHIGLTLPSMSKMIDNLVARRLVLREFDPGDRRRIRLALTAHGRSILETSRGATRAYLTDKLSAVSPDGLEMIFSAMELLRPLFISEREAQSLAARRQNGNS